MAEEVTKKVEIYSKYKGPGAARYGLPSTCGAEKHDFTRHKKPAYSFGSKCSNSMYGKDISPGPCYALKSEITRHGVAGDYKYSIQGRAKDPPGFKTPAPGAYSPEKCHPQHEKHAPSYSLAARTRFRKRDTTPAPNANTLPVLISNNPVKKSAPCYSLTGRSEHGGFAEVTVKTPGPGAHKTVDPNSTRNKAPQYSMLARSYMPGDSVQKPGPGQHQTVNPNNTKKKAPSFSLGIRHSEHVTPLIIHVAD